MKILASCLPATLLLAFALPAQRSGRAPAAPPGPSLRSVLDADSDGALSSTEIREAPTKLRTLDRDGDGTIEAAECRDFAGSGFGGFGRRGPPGGFGRRGSRGRPSHPFDKDRDGSLSASEIIASAATLRALDGDRDGQLSARELDHALPEPEESSGMSFGRGRDSQRTTPVLPEELAPADGAAEIPDRASYERLSYRGENVMVDQHLRNQEFVKFQIQDGATDKPRVYFFNTNKWRAHPMFSGAMGLQGLRGRRRRGEENSGPPKAMRGVLVYRPRLTNARGGHGLYTFEFNPGDNYPYPIIKLAYDLLIAKAKVLRGRLAYHPLSRDEAQARSQSDLYAKAKLPLFFAADAYKDLAYLALHEATSFGTLRKLTPEERPGARDIVIYDALPNEMPRVAGIMTAVRQTPLSHVNLRAVQDDLPNAFVKGCGDDPKLRALLGKYVAYTVRNDGYSLREASAEEVQRHFAAMRPQSAQLPQRDLEAKEIRSLAEIGHEDWKAYGVKAANLGVLRSLQLPCKTVRIGFAVPFSFYDSFMKHNRFYERARSMLAEEGFRTDAAKRRAALRAFRKDIKRADLPAWMMTALGEMQSNFGEGARIRCRSSTNNEDLPKFSGAGLYDSFTHRVPEGHIAKSIRQVWASLWNFRAFEEREFFRIDHFQTAMGVLCHPNFEGELANGVGVSKDVVYGSENMFYVNARPGEDLVTNPDAASAPEELLLSPRDFRSDRYVSFANGQKASLLNGIHTDDLRESLQAIETKFRAIYGLLPQALFAMEVEFKITKSKKLAIKQARPWIF